MLFFLSTAKVYLHAHIHRQNVLSVLGPSLKYPPSPEFHNGSNTGTFFFLTEGKSVAGPVFVNPKPTSLIYCSGTCF